MKINDSSKHYEELDKRLDIFAEFLLDRCLEKIREDKKKLQQVKKGGSVELCQ